MTVPPSSQYLKALSMFEGVVDEQGGKLTDPALVGQHPDIRLDLEDELLLILLGQRFVRLHGLLHVRGDVDLRHDRAVLPLLRTGNHHQILHESVEPVDLTHRRLGPLVLPVHHFLDFGVGADDGQRRLQLVGRVGDELLLPPDVFQLRADDPGGKNVDQQERDAHPADGDPERHSENPFNRTDLGLAVDEGGDVASVAAAPGFPEVDAGPAETDLLADDAVGHPDAFLFAYFGDMGVNDIRYRLAVRFVEDREITRG